MIYTMDKIEGLLLPIAKRYGVGKIVLFGSYARGQASSASDLDFYIEEKGDLVSIFQTGGMLSELEEAFDKKVDIVSGNVADGDLLRSIQREGKVVYEDRQKCGDYRQNSSILRTSFTDSRALWKSARTR